MRITVACTGRVGPRPGGEAGQGAVTLMLSGTGGRTSI